MEQRIVGYHSRGVAAEMERSMSLRWAEERRQEAAAHGVPDWVVNPDWGHREWGRQAGVARRGEEEGRGREDGATHRSLRQRPTVRDRSR